jgi:hypothetical protein
MSPIEKTEYFSQAVHALTGWRNKPYRRPRHEVHNVVKPFVSISAARNPKIQTEKNQHHD